MNIHKKKSLRYISPCSSRQAPISYPCRPFHCFQYWQFALVSLPKDVFKPFIFQKNLKMLSFQFLKKECASYYVGGSCDYEHKVRRKETCHDETIGYSGRWVKRGESGYPLPIQHPPWQLSPSGAQRTRVSSVLEKIHPVRTSFWREIGEY